MIFFTLTHYEISFCLYIMLFLLQWLTLHLWNVGNESTDKNPQLVDDKDTQVCFGVRKKRERSLKF